MSTTRRGFLGALLAVPLVRLLRLGASKPSVVATQDAGDSFDAHMARRMPHYTGAIVPTKYAPNGVGRVISDGSGRKYILRSDPRHKGYVAGSKVRFWA